jgi:hypothetical protein
MPINQSFRNSAVRPRLTILQAACWPIDGVEMLTPPPKRRGPGAAIGGRRKTAISFVIGPIVLPKTTDRGITQM